MPMRFRTLFTTTAALAVALVPPAAYAFSFPSLFSPEIVVEHDGDTLDNDDAVIDFGEVTQGATPTSQTFAVSNDSFYADLNISNVSVPSGYTIIDDLVSQLDYWDSDTLTIQLDTTTTGTKAGEIVITSDDEDNGEFIIPVTGSVVETSPSPTPTPTPTLTPAPEPTPSPTPTPTPDPTTEIQFDLTGLSPDSYINTVPSNVGPLTVSGEVRPVMIDNEPYLQLWETVQPTPNGNEIRWQDQNAYGTLAFSNNYLINRAHVVPGPLLQTRLRVYGRTAEGAEVLLADKMIREPKVVTWYIPDDVIGIQQLTWQPTAKPVPIELNGRGAIGQLQILTSRDNQNVDEGVAPWVRTFHGNGSPTCSNEEYYQFANDVDAKRDYYISLLPNPYIVQTRSNTHDALRPFVNPSDPYAGWVGPQINTELHNHNNNVTFYVKEAVRLIGQGKGVPELDAIMEPAGQAAEKYPAKGYIRPRAGNLNDFYDDTQAIFDVGVDQKETIDEINQLAEAHKQARAYDPSAPNCSGTGGPDPSPSPTVTPTPTPAPTLTPEPEPQPDLEIPTTEEEVRAWFESQSITVRHALTATYFEREEFGPILLASKDSTTVFQGDIRRWGSGFTEFLLSVLAQTADVVASDAGHNLPILQRSVDGLLLSQAPQIRNLAGRSALFIGVAGSTDELLQDVIAAEGSSELIAIALAQYGFDLASPAFTEALQGYLAAYSLSVPPLPMIFIDICKLSGGSAFPECIPAPGDPIGI